MPEQADVAITLWPCIREVLRSNLGRDAILTVFREFPQSLRTNAGKVPGEGHGRFLPDFFNSAIFLPASIIFNDASIFRVEEQEKQGSIAACSLLVILTAS
jgi:hypothetical protein